MHHWMISDYSTARPLRPIERMLFTAAPSDQRVARAIHMLLGRMGTPQRILTPGLLARAGWVSARVALRQKAQPAD